MATTNDITSKNLIDTGFAMKSDEITTSRTWYLLDDMSVYFENGKYGFNKTGMLQKVLDHLTQNGI